MIEIVDRKIHEGDVSHWLLFISFLFFTLWGILTIYLKQTDFIFDRFFSAGLVLVIYLFYRYVGLRLGAVAIALFALFLHHLKLYGMFFFGIPFDRIMHFTAGLAIAILVYDFLRKSNIPSWGVVLIAVFVAMGAGCVMEIIEFIGYSLGGFGEGLLFFGKGDFGEFNNISWDLINNTLGAIIGAMLAFIYDSWKK